MITTAPPPRGKNTLNWCRVASFGIKLSSLYRAFLNVSRLTSSRWVPLQSAHTIDWTCHPPRIFRLFLNHDCEPRFARGTFSGSRVVQKNDAEFLYLVPNDWFSDFFAARWDFPSVPGISLAGFPDRGSDRCRKLSVEPPCRSGAHNR